MAGPFWAMSVSHRRRNFASACFCVSFCDSSVVIIDELIGAGLQIVEELERRLVGAVHEVAGIHPVGRANPFPAGDGSRDDNEFAQKVLAPIGRRLALGKRNEAATTLSSRRVIAVW